MKIRSDRRSARRVLVADDDDDIRKVVKVNLEAEGFSVDTAANGWDAVAKAVAIVPDLVVLDIGMPGLSGLDVLTRLRGYPSTRRIPVALLTARTSDEDVWTGWKSGAAYYLTKPFDAGELMRFVHYLFDTPRTGT